MTITRYNVTDENTWEILKTYKAVIITKEQERSKALAMFGNHIQELKRQVSNNWRQETVLLFSL